MTTRSNRLNLRLLMLLMLTLCGSMAASAGNGFSRLDSLIAAQPRLVAEKERQLAAMKAQLAHVKTPQERYDALKGLYEQYSAYQYDSAYSYVAQCIDLAEAMGNATLSNEARLNLLHILLTSGLMDKAESVMHEIDTARLTLDQFIQYRRLQANMLIYQAEYMQGTQYAQEYINRLIALRREIIGISDRKDNINYLLTLAESEADKQQLDRAVSLLEEALKRYHSGERMYSVITSTMSFFYMQQGDKDRQMDCLISSAESDLEGCIRENTSLRMIADRLFDEGDIDRAYR